MTNLSFKAALNRWIIQYKQLLRPMLTEWFDGIGSAAESVYGDWKKRETGLQFVDESTGEQSPFFPCRYTNGAYDISDIPDKRWRDKVDSVDFHVLTFSEKDLFWDERDHQRFIDDHHLWTDHADIWLSDEVSPEMRSVAVAAYQIVGDMSRGNKPTDLLVSRALAFNWYTTEPGANLNALGMPELKFQSDSGKTTDKEPRHWLFVLGNDMCRNNLAVLLEYFDDTSLATVPWETRVQDAWAATGCGEYPPRLSDESKTAVSPKKPKPTSDRKGRGVKFPPKDDQALLDEWAAYKASTGKTQGEFEAEKGLPLNTISKTQTRMRRRRQNAEKKK